MVVIGNEMGAQQLGRGARNQKAVLRVRRAGEGAAEQVGDETRRPLDRLQRDIARKPVVDDHIDIAARQFVALDEAGELHRQPARLAQPRRRIRSEEHTSELQSLMRTSYAVFCLNNTKKTQNHLTYLSVTHKTI